MTLDRFKLIWLTMASITVALWIAAYWTLYQIPHVDDLYNAIYENSRPKRPESAAVFLFVFPAFCAALSVTIPIGTLLSFKRSVSQLALKVNFAVFLFVVFATVSVFRIITVYRYFDL